MNREILLLITVVFISAQIALAFYPGDLYTTTLRTRTMTDPLPLQEGLSAGESSENGSLNDTNEVDNLNKDSIVDRFSCITIIDQSSDANSQTVSAQVVATHIIVLVHGWMGNPAEMGYIRESIQNAATSKEANHRFVIHSAACNSDKTDDGIAVGGGRLAQEINDLVAHVVDQNMEKHSSHKFTLSIVGNSLGGLYARHALAGIQWDIGGSESSSPPAMLIPSVFVTTATPHLGISQHTYVPLPRAAEFVVAQGMKETGRDFFRFTQVIEDLFCKDYFLDPLSSFQKRIAYINVYGTDFQVPTATAAFWAPDSDSLHHRIKDPVAETTGDNESSATPKSIIMMLTTPRCPEQTAPVDDTTGEEKKGEEGDERVEETEKTKADSQNVFTSWSKRLDRLGWTKVLVDVREDVPDVRQVRDSIKMVIDGSSSSDGSEDEGNETASKASDSDPKNEDEAKDTLQNEEGNSNDVTKINQDESNKEETDTPDESKTDADAADDAIPHWTTKDTWTAGELLAEFKGGLLKASGTKQRRESLWDLKPRLPLGHTVMIANAKDAFNKKVTSGGKPVMDYLGASLVRTLQDSVPTSRGNATDAVEIHEC